MSKATDKPQFTFDPLYGTMFPGTRCWSGNWSEIGGAPTHLIALGEKDGVHRVAFKVIGGRKWTYCDITFAAEGLELEKRNHKGYVVFKGNKLNLWLNYAKGHENDTEHERYDLKPSSRAARPF
jgi:hypothetical protein